MRLKFQFLRIGSLALFLAGTTAFAKTRSREKRPLPNSWNLIAQSLSGSMVPYQGKMETTSFLGSSNSISITSIRFAPPRFYRREVFGPDGKVRIIAILNEKEEWVYRRDAKEYWKMPAPAPLDAKKELSLLKANYQASAPVSSHAASRRAFKIELWSRKDHALSRVFWLNPKYGVILKTEVYDSKGRLKSRSAFKKIRFFVKKPVPKKWFTFTPPKKARSAQENLLTLKQSAQKKFGITPLTPSWLPFGYALEDIRALNHKGRVVIQEEFSDGINALSLFEYKDSGPVLTGQKIALKKRTAYLKRTSEGRVLCWKEGNLSLALISTLDQEKLIRVAESIP